MPERHTVLVTGVTGGIGAAVARALAPRHDLVLSGRDALRLRPLCEELGARPWVADLLDAERLEQALTELPVASSAVHCAGMYERGLIADLSPEAWRRSFQLNVFAPVRITQALLPGIRQAAGTVVFLNSGAGLFSYRTGAIYSATKYALRAFADTLRLEESRYGVRVSSIHPGRVDTDMLRRSVEEFEAGDYRSEEYLRPEEVAELVVTAVELRAGVALEEVRLRPLAPDPLG